MKTKLNIHFIFVLIFIIKTLSLHSQNFPVPFDSTWYGFNLQANTQNFFVTYSKLVDIDNDGDSDVVASKYHMGTGENFTGFVVLKNNGNGFFNTTPVYYGSLQPSEYVETADINNDGLKDVIVPNTGINYEGNTISVYLNQGNAIFGTPSNYSVGNGPVGIAAADYNGDGKIDLAVANYGLNGNGSTISVLINNGTGVFNAAVSYPAGAGPYRIAAGKINSDNFTDIVVANLDARINVMVNSGSGTFSNHTEYIAASTGQNYFSSICLADMDNDNDLDILYSSSAMYGQNAPYIALFSNQNGTLSAPVLIDLYEFASTTSDIKAADLNGDGWEDIITTSPSARTSDGFQISFSNGSGGFLPAVVNFAGQKTNTIMIGDANNDGLPDVVTTDSYSMMVTVHKNLGGANFPHPRIIETGQTTAGFIDAADIDNDGDLDIVVSASGRATVGVQVKVLKNLGNGNFGPPVDYSIRDGGVAAKFRDLNNDNKPDLLYATAISSPPFDFHYAINNGDGTFGAVQTKALGACGWYDIEAADLNNDGKKDVIVTEWLGCQNVIESSKRIYICLNQGNAVFANPIIKLVGPNPTTIGIADFNKDGKLDLATPVSGGKIEIDLGIGNGDLLPPVQYSFGLQGGTVSMVVTDFNNDNKEDIAACNFYENYWVSVFHGNGDGTFQGALIYPTAYSPDLLNVSGITVGDLDNDGDKDIIVANYASKTLSLYYNTNGFFDYKLRAGGFNGIFSPFFADFDNDGKGDILAPGELAPYGFFSGLVFLKGKNTGLSGVSISGNQIPESFVLGQNYPNPFNPSTVIRYSLPVSVTGSMIPVNLTVFDITGRTVSVVVNEQQLPGNYNVTFDGSSLASGIYFYRIVTPDFTQSKKMMLIK